MSKKPGKLFNPWYKFPQQIYIPECVFRQNDITDAEKLMLGRLFKFAGENGKAYPTRKRLAWEMGWSLAKVDRTIRKLKESNLIQTSQVDEHSPSIYSFLYHKIYNDKSKYTPSKSDNAPTVKTDSTPTSKNDSTPPVKSAKHKEVNNQCKSISKECFYSKNGKDELCDDMLNGLYCSKCGGKQYETKSGATCKKGHGGTEGIKKKKKKRKKKSKTVAKKKVVSAKTKEKRTDIDNWLDLFDYYKNTKTILRFWHICGGKVHKTMKGKKGASAIDTAIFSLLMDGLNQYSKVLPKELQHLKSKKWTVKEIISCIDNHANTRFKPIETEYFSDFIIKRYVKRKDIADRSLLAEAFDILSNGTLSALAERLKKQLSPLRPEENTSDKVFITAADRLEAFTSSFKMFDSTAVGYDHDPIKPFLKYVKLKANESNWKLGYISGNFVYDDFGNAMLKNNVFEKIKKGKVNEGFKGK